MICAILSTLFLGIVVAVVVDYIISLFQLKKYPPGPFPLPLVGNLHWLGGPPTQLCDALRKKYGNVASLSIGRKRLVIVQGLNEARDALSAKGEAFAGRPNDNYAVDLITEDFNDIAFGAYGPRLKAMRKIAHGALKMYGEGLAKLEGSILMEVEKLFERFDENKDEAFNPDVDLCLAVSNIICTILFGRRYEKDESELQDVLKFTSLTLRYDLTALVNFVPLLRLLPNKLLSNFKLGVAMKDRFFDKKLREHMESFDQNNLRDFTDFVLHNFENERKADSKIQSYIHDVNLRQILSDLLLAGGETTSTVLRWSLLYLATLPEIQQKIAIERRQKIGSRQPRLNDRRNLPYFEAVLMEILRMSTVTPLILRKTITDTQCDGQSIPAETVVWFFLPEINSDTKEWNEPDVFKPERFLDENGDMIHRKSKREMSFGLGRRSCLGEVLAKAELFIFLSNILYRYEIRMDKADFPGFDAVFCVVRVPKPYKIRLVKRSINED
ncbi:steroid 17-alpha-hydroxylase/17,20 lyase-like [Rhopilema esculentum]|uniref:steroid 17-alpha-hydroxylase/17,20 lyase-like n=1 Tax=Rhopilema esculentum TaxID=499914 RepID=UPI0031DB616D|eukprot:gene11398-21597_t